MLEIIDQWDKNLFLLLNGIHAPWLDPIMAYGTEQLTWIPLYLLFIYFIYKVEGNKWVYIILLIAFTILLTDQFSASLMKPMIGRLRPCYSESLEGLVHLVGRCGGKYGFISSHAANTFGVASFLFFLLRGRLHYIGWIFLWSALVSYTRIYLGVHYPLDVFFGALSGIIIGYLVYRLYLLYKLQIQPRP